MKAKLTETEVEAFERPRRAIPFLRTIRRLLRMPLACVGFAVIFIVVTCAIFAPQIAPHDPAKQNTGHYLETPSATFPLGTDQLGRDVLSRIIYGSRIALIVGLGAVSFGIAIGTPVGLIAAYARGWVDAVLMRIMDTIIAFPSLIIAIALIAAMGSSLINVIIAIGVANIPGTARIVRSQALSVRERDFITAARAIGASGQRIIFRHIWPNCTAPVIVLATLALAYAIIAEAGLSFLGLGIPPPAASWGRELRFAFDLLDIAPLLSIVPGIAIFLTVLSFNFVGDALRDILDPRLRGLIH